jgi:hypothetical protein
MIDPRWLDALKLPLKATLATALASSVLFVLDLNDVLDLGALGAVVRPALIVVMVVSGTMSVVNIADLALAPLRERRHVSTLAARRAVRKQEAEEEAERRRTSILAQLDHLSEQEVRYVAGCLRNNTLSGVSAHGTVLGDWATEGFWLIVAIVERR